MAEPPAFGKVTLEELVESYYGKDSTAGAVILNDVGKPHIEYNQKFEIRHTRQVRVKIYSRLALDWGNVSVPYYTENVRDMEIVRDIEAYVYNIENDLIVRKELDKHAVYDNKLSEKWSEKVFALPDVKEGSVIEYRYTVVSPFLFNLRDWQFQYEVPVKWSEYEVKIPTFYEYQMLYQGYQPLEVNESKVLRMKNKLGQYEFQNVVYKWGLKDVPAFKEESFITTKEDYIAKMIFQLAKVNYPGRVVKEYMSTWNQLVKDFLSLSDFGKNLKKKHGDEIVASFNLEIPEGYKLEEFPDTETLSLEDNSVQFTLQSAVSELNAQILVMMRINRPVVDAKYYLHLREIYHSILAKYSEEIVLKKI